MITGITIENFKGIRERVKLDFRPITLLFGANSAGKSTILHALHYAREIFERHNYGPDRTTAGGSYVDLGGFAGFVHGHDKSLPIVLSISVSLHEEYLYDYGTPRFIFASYEDPEDFLGEVRDAEVCVTVQWSELHSSPVVTSLVVRLNGVGIAEVSYQPGRKGVRLGLFMRHPALLPASECEQLGFLFSDLDSDEELVSGLEYLFTRCDSLGVGLSEEFQDGWWFTDLDEEDALLSPNGVYVPTSRVYNEDTAEEFLDGLIQSNVSRIVSGPIRIVTEHLKQFRYLGPLRDTPPRNFEPPRFVDATRWSSGLGAWDNLFVAENAFIEKVSDWLSAEDKLNAGCSIERRSFLELDLSNPIIRKLYDGRAFDEVDSEYGLDLTETPINTRLVIVPTQSNIELRPHDVGVGISQVLPVIVTALDSEKRLLAIEQPELHIHPRLQAEIADLFIEAIHKNKHRFIIETHSEHLILRLLRRIRETEVNKAPANRTLRTDDLAIYYLKQEDGSSRAVQIDVDVKGEFIQPWPDDFFEIDFYERFKTGDEG